MQYKPMDNGQQAELQADGQQLSELPTDNETTNVTTQGEESSPEPELPDEAKERTRQEFEKLKLKNKELAEKLKLYEQPKRSVFDTFAPKMQPVKQEIIEEDIPEITPDEEGYLDVSTLNQANRAMINRIKRLEEEARLARQKAELAETKIATYEHTEKSSRVYQKHPHLNPESEQFDEKFSDLVRKELLDQMVNQGREDYLEAAEKVKKEYYNPETITKIDDSKKKESIDKRSQVATFQSATQQSNLPDLVKASRLSRTALYERLKKSGY